MKPPKKAKRRSRLTGEEGQSLVEMALFVPFLAFLLLGLIELSQAFATYVALISATREGALYASLNPDLANGATNTDTYSNYYQRITSEAVAVGLDLDELTVSSPVAPDLGANCPITVSLSYQLTTFSSTISLPYFGRMGLPSTYTIAYSMQTPIRESDSLGCIQ